MKKHFLSILLTAGLFQIGFSQTNYFFPSGKSFNKNISTPEEFLGYAIGTHHTRHDKVIEYIKTLDRLSTG